MIVWILAFSYWIHLMTTVVWIGGLVLLGLLALPAWRAGSLTDNQWLALQKRLIPWTNGAMALMWISGFVQMTNDAQYNGFMVIDSGWAWAMLVKHVAALLMTGLTLYIHFRVFPSMERVVLLGARASAETQKAALAQQESNLLRLNLFCATVVLLCTAIATAL